MIGMTIPEMTVWIPAFLLALTVHEFMHAWTADRCGDDTARLMGRVTFNPVSHLDLTGSLLLVFLGFGWGKPVPVNPVKLRDPRRHMFLVSMAGPLSNIALASVSGLGLRTWLLTQDGVVVASGGLVGWLIAFGIALFRINAILAVFNLLPLPPLDGSEILFALLPGRGWETKMRVFSSYGHIFLLVLMVMGGSVLWRFILGPATNVMSHVFCGVGVDALRKLSITVLGVG